MFYHDKMAGRALRIGRACGRASHPNSLPQSEELKQYSYALASTSIDGSAPNGRWTSGKSIDGKGEFSVIRGQLIGGEPKLSPPAPKGHAQKEQMTTTDNIIGGIKDIIS